MGISVFACYYQYATMRAHDKTGRKKLAGLYARLPFSARLFVRLRLAILPLEEVESAVPSGAVLDVGCGYGLLAHYMAAKDPRRTVTGLEYDSVLVARAGRTAEGVPRVRFVRGDAETMVPERYDGVVLCDVLHHLSPAGQEHLLAAAARSLRPGGRLIAKDIEKERSVFYYWNLFHDRVMRLSGPTFHRTAEEWADMARAGGLRIAEIRHFRHLLYHHILVVAERP